MVGSCICFEVIVDIVDFAAADRAPCCVRRSSNVQKVRELIRALVAAGCW